MKVETSSAGVTLSVDKFKAIIVVTNDFDENYYNDSADIFITSHNVRSASGESVAFSTLSSAKNSTTLSTTFTRHQSLLLFQKIFSSSIKLFAVKSPQKTTKKSTGVARITNSSSGTASPLNSRKKHTADTLTDKPSGSGCILIWTPDNPEHSMNSIVILGNTSLHDLSSTLSAHSELSSCLVAKPEGAKEPMRRVSLSVSSAAHGMITQNGRKISLPVVCPLTRRKIHSSQSSLSSSASSIRASRSSMTSPASPAKSPEPKKPPSTPTSRAQGKGLKKKPANASKNSTPQPTTTSSTPSRNVGKKTSKTAVVSPSPARKPVGPSARRKPSPSPARNITDRRKQPTKPANKPKNAKYSAKDKVDARMQVSKEKDSQKTNKKDKCRSGSPAALVQAPTHCLADIDAIESDSVQSPPLEKTSISELGLSVEQPLEKESADAAVQEDLEMSSRTICQEMLTEPTEKVTSSANPAEGHVHGSAEKSFFPKEDSPDSIGSAEKICVTLPSRGEPDGMSISTQSSSSDKLPVVLEKTPLVASTDEVTTQCLSRSFAHVPGNPFLDPFTPFDPDGSFELNEPAFEINEHSDAFGQIPMHQVIETFQPHDNILINPPPTTDDMHADVDRTPVENPEDNTLEIKCVPNEAIEVKPIPLVRVESCSPKTQSSGRDDVSDKATEPSLSSLAMVRDVPQEQFTDEYDYKSKETGSLKDKLPFRCAEESVENATLSDENDAAVIAALVKNGMKVESEEFKAKQKVNLQDETAAKNSTKQAQPTSSNVRNSRVNRASSISSKVTKSKTSFVCQFDLVILSETCDIDMLYGIKCNYLFCTQMTRDIFDRLVLRTDPVNVFCTKLSPELTEEMMNRIKITVTSDLTSLPL